MGQMEATEALTNGDQLQKCALLAMMKSNNMALFMAQHPQLCHVVQAVFTHDVASAAERYLLAKQLLVPQMLVTLMMHKSGNFVIAKIVDMLPSCSLSPIVEAVRGNEIILAKDCIGSRSIEKLLMHAFEELECSGSIAVL